MRFHLIKIQIFILLVLSCLCHFKAFAVEDPDSQNTKDFRNAIVKLADRSENEQLRATGFFIGASHLITTFHVISGFLENYELKNIFLLSKDGTATSHKNNKNCGFICSL